MLHSVQFSSVAQSCLTLCDPMNRSTPGLPVHHQLPDITVCKIDSQHEFVVWLRKLKQGLCINLEGWDGREMGGRFKRRGIYVYPWLIHVEV